MENIYFFHWPSNLGGADTRLKDLIQLFSESKLYKLFCIPNDNFRLLEKHNTDFLNENNVTILDWDSLPSKTNGYAIAFCNFRLFSEDWRIKKIKDIGLKFIWSNDMMWTTDDEIRCLKNNLIDAHIYTSEFHQQILENRSPELKSFRSFILPNYFHFENYKRLPKKENLKENFIIGKLSRADIMKYSENFPLFFNKINIPNIKFRIMGWSKELSEKFKWFSFNEKRWDLLSENSETIIEFLSQLNLYVFNAHHDYIENQTRSMIEAQLLGIPAIVPNYGNFPNMIWHGRNGFIYNNIEELYNYINILYTDESLYNQFCINSLNLSKFIWTDKNNQLKHWKDLFSKI